MKSPSYYVTTWLSQLSKEYDSNKANHLVYLIFYINNNFFILCSELLDKKQ